MSPFKFHGGTFRWCSCAAAVRGFWCSGTDNSVFRSGSSFKRSYLHFDLFLIIHQPEMFCHTYSFTQPPPERNVWPLWDSYPY